MTIIQTIDDQSPHLESVKKLWRLHSDTLGPFPNGAFLDYATARRILVALNDKNCIGYLIYRIVRDRATIVHLCVASEARKLGIPHQLVNHLVSITKANKGIVLSCRRDFEQANKCWKRLGFHAGAEYAGRSRKGSKLVRWSMDYGKADLFTAIENDSDVLTAAIDANIFIDLVEEKEDVESIWLQAEWMIPYVQLYCTNEIFNDIDRTEDDEVRKQRKSEASYFSIVQHTKEAYDKAESSLRPLFSELRTEQDESDFRHLVRSIAGEVDVFVTLDDKILRKAEEIKSLFELEILRPAELASRLDAIHNEREYQRKYIAGTNQVTRVRINQISDAILASIQREGEKQNLLKIELNRYLGDSQNAKCFTLSNQNELIAFYVVASKDNCEEIPFLRVCQNRMASTVARCVLTNVIRETKKNGNRSILITDKNLSSLIQTACADLGFVSVGNGWLKFVLSGCLSNEDVKSQMNWQDAKVDEIKAILDSAKSDHHIASRIEHFIHPAKLSEADIPCFIVPILPQFAEQLFDERLASGNMFGADVDLAMNPESVYYRAAKPAVITSPSRVLWYVCQRDNFDGSKAIRACSRIVEVVIGKPKQLFKRFERLGVYRWNDVYETADKDVEKDVMAFRFDDTELLKPIPWESFQNILKKHGINFNMYSPYKISSQIFEEIYALAFDSSQVR